LRKDKLQAITVALAVSERRSCVRSSTCAGECAGGGNAAVYEQCELRSKRRPPPLYGAITQRHGAVSKRRAAAATLSSKQSTARYSGRERNGRNRDNAAASTCSNITVSVLAKRIRALCCKNMR
jgi:hypothetical protein